VAGAPFDIPAGNIAGLFLDAVDTFQKPDALKYKRGGAWLSISHGKIYQDVKRAALGLEALGLQPGDRVAILSENRPEWLISDFACVMSRTVSVPLHPVLPAEQIEYMLRDSEARAAFVSGAEQRAKVEAVRRQTPALEHVISYEGARGVRSGLLTLHDLQGLGDRRLGSVADADYRARALDCAPDDLFTVLYTSGTTGRPKGVMLTHANLRSNVWGALQVLELGPADVSLSVLPLSHVFERMAGHLTMFSAGVTVCYAGSFESVGQDMLEVRPTVMTLVPRGYEKIYARVEEAARAGGARKLALLKWSIGIGKKRLARRTAGKPVGPWLAARYALADRLVFAKLRARTGGRVRLFVSGGAPLNPDLARFFFAAGLTILEGYGLTETSPVIAVPRLGKVKIGTVGPPLPGVEVAIAEDGEILTRGPHVMRGYFRDPEATAAAIEPDGWFHTGDIGELDEDGYLTITDRKKDLIITAGGKNIAPQLIENRVAANPYVNQVVMIGDRRRFPVLLISPRFEALESWARSEGIEYETREALVRDPRVVEFLEREILDPLDDLARYERPKRLAVLSRELSIDSGEVTPTLKVRRRIVESKYRELIDALYEGD
jgi:long-chain acyl-CoA synthetase